MKKRVELLAPAGNLEKLKMAVQYGADAVYLAGKLFGLRTASDNFSFDEMKEGVSYAHEHGKKAYLTMNIIAHNQNVGNVVSFLEEAVKTGIDGVIVSDPGIFQIIRRPARSAHSYQHQTSTANYRTVEFWHRLGAKGLFLPGSCLMMRSVRSVKRCPMRSWRSSSTEPCAYPIREGAF